MAMLFKSIEIEPQNERDTKWSTQEWLANLNQCENMNFYRINITPRFAVASLVACLAGFCANHTVARGLDESWVVSVDGQAVQDDPDGTFIVPHVSASDQIGFGGAGRSPDFTSNDFIRAVAVTRKDVVTRYVFSEPLQFPTRQTSSIGSVTLPIRLSFSRDTPQQRSVCQTEME